MATVFLAHCVDSRSPYKILKAALLEIFLLTLLGCDERNASDGALTAGCPHYTSIVDGNLKRPHQTPSQCKVLVMMCNACVYKTDGSLSHSTSEVCGACLGGSF